MSLKKKVVWLPYDMDTAIGINNSGELVFDYNLEDTDHTTGGEVIYHGQNSVIWCNIRDAFPEELMKMYQELRADGVLSYENVEKRFEDHQNVWSEALFNEDSRFKYIDPFVNGGDNRLGMLQGSKAEQRKWWLYNRFKYIDSKYVAGDSKSDIISLRPYAVDNIRITPYADIYATVAWDNEITQERCPRNTTVEIICPYTAMNYNIVTIYNASQLASIGDLSNLKTGLLNVAKATRLQNIKLGDSDSNYDNKNLGELTLGNNVLLQTLDVRNCSGLGDTSIQGHTQQTVDISGCSIIEEVYFDGTNITGLTLPNGGVLKVLHLPSTITNLTILNQPSITDLTVAGYDNISTLRLENVPTIDDETILRTIPSGARVRLIGFYWEAEDADEINDLLDLLDNMRGLDESGNNVDTAQVSGTIHTGSLTGSQIVAFNQRYPYLTITADHTTSTLTYMTYDGSSVITTETIYDGGDGTVVNTTARAADSRYTYTPNGWSLVANGNPNANALVNVVADRTVYAAYDAEGQKYTVRFYNGSTLLQTVNNVLYGGTAEYTGTTPVYNGEGDPEDYEFSGWSPSNENIEGDTACYAQYNYLGVVARALVQRTFSGEYTNETVETIGNYAFYNCRSLTTADFPVVTSIGSHSFYCCTSLTTADFPVATNIGNYAFYSCTSLTTADFPVATNIGDYTFYNCYELTTADFPVATSMGSNAFYNCYELTTVDLPLVTSIGSSSFYNCYELTTADFPVATSIGNNAFQGCTSLTTVDLPVARSINQYAFKGCSELTALILRNTERVTTLNNTNAFSNANNAIIYVPDALVDSYKAATNWSTYADRIVALSEYTG